MKQLIYTQQLQSMTHPVILRNAIQTPDGTILESTHRNDYQQHTDTIDGQWYMVDGGTEYFRGSVDNQNTISLRVTTDSPHEKIREVFKWTSSFDKDMKPIHPVQRKLSELEDGHILALVKWTADGYPDYIYWVICNEADYRGLEFRVDNTSEMLDTAGLQPIYKHF